MKQSFNILFPLFLSIFTLTGYADTDETMKEDKTHVNKWNNFAERIHVLHLQALNHSNLTKQTQTGGYSDEYKDFYIEHSYYHNKTGKLISRLQLERENPDNIHLIEFYIYDDKNRVKLDYLAAYLPQGRNAPVQTLINVHHYDDQLHAFRQFDANGDLIYEQCKGKFFDKPIFISLDDDEIINRFRILKSEMEQEAYRSCFENVSRNPDNYLNPLVHSPYKSATAQIDHDESVVSKLALLSDSITASPTDAALLIQRGQLYLQTKQFENSIADFSRAIEIDPELDAAWFGRGMARGRVGDISGGIEDLSVFIERHPDSSLAYTKRGVRNIWAGNMSAAKADLTRAVELDNTNSEAHDDLGVVYSSEKNYLSATYHFQQAIKHDASYEKAYYNLATVYTLNGNLADALNTINLALRLAPEDKDSLLLKSTVLKALGRHQEAAMIKQHADFLPDGNWTERMTVH